MKDVDGSFKALETNTSIQLGVQFQLNFDSGSFESFVESNSFTKICLIHGPQNVITHTDFTVDYDIEPATALYSSASQAEVHETSGSQLRTPNKLAFDKYLDAYCSGSNLTFERYETDENSVTIPHIEDADDKLIIRLSYDATALIDDTYAKDNWEFLKLMYDTDINSIPKCYINDSQLGFDSIGTELRDNGNHPNYCVKKRVTPSDNKVYPKLCKINTVAELDTLKAGLQSDEYIQEFIYNTEDKLDNRIKSYRSIDMVYGSSLDTLNLNVVERTTLLETVPDADFDDNNEVQVWDRLRYLQKFSNNTSDFAVKLSADSNTRILYTNNTTGNAAQLNIGDSVKSINFESVDPNYSGSLQNWSASYTSISTEYNVTSSALRQKEEFDYFGQITTFTTSEGSVFSDVNHALIMAITGSEVIFQAYENLKVNDSVVVFDNETQTIITSTVTDISYKYEKLNAYILDFEELDLFLTLEETPDRSRYGLIVHNYDYSCWYVQCYSYNCPYYYPPGYYGYACGSGVGFGSRVSWNAGYYGYACIRRTANNGNSGYGGYPAYCYCESDPYSWGPDILESNCNGQKSDMRYKENLVLTGKSPSGLNIYQFNYKEEEGLMEGVIAQELIGTEFENALSQNEEGFYLVDYNMIDVEFKKIK
jgi:hypothetical protein